MDVWQLFTGHADKVSGARDLNSQPSDYESPHLTTRPGLPPMKC